MKFFDHTAKLNYDGNLKGIKLRLGLGKGEKLFEVYIFSDMAKKILNEEITSKKIFSHPLKISQHKKLTKRHLKTFMKKGHTQKLP